MNFRFGIGAYSQEQSFHSFAQMEQYSIKHIAYVIGGLMLIAHLHHNFIEIMKNYIVIQTQIQYDIRIEK